MRPSSKGMRLSLFVQLLDDTWPYILILFCVALLAHWAQVPSPPQINKERKELAEFRQIIREELKNALDHREAGTGP
jgi:hypothetical protein